MLTLFYFLSLDVLSISSLYYFLSTSLPPLPYQWKEFVICCQNKTVNLLGILSGQRCLMWNPESGVGDTKHIPYLQSSCRRLLTQHEGWVQKSGQLIPRAWLLSAVSLGTHGLASVFLLKRVWIRLQMHFFLPCFLAFHDWYSCCSNVCLIVFAHVRLWYISGFISVHLHIKSVLRKRMEGEHVYKRLT